MGLGEMLFNVFMHAMAEIIGNWLQIRKLYKLDDEDNAGKRQNRIKEADLKMKN